MKTQPFTIERTYNASISRVWKAITDKDEMKKWYFDIASFKPEIGFEFSFVAPGKDEREQFLHLCKIVEVIPGKKLSYTWQYEKVKGISTVTFELFAEDANTTRLKLTHEGLESFVNGGSDFARESFAEGWTYIIGTSLNDYVSGK